MPDALTLRRHRDLEGRGHQLWVRRVLLLALVAFCAVGLADVFGQQPDTRVGVSPPATLTVSAPSQARGGLLYQARFTVRATRVLRNAQLVLSRGWVDGLTINTIEPGPLGEASRDGRLAFRLGHVPAGQSFVLYLDYQVNPTTVGRRVQVVDLDDGPRHLLTIRRTLTVFP
jgi:hypothetical protein